MGAKPKFLIDGQNVPPPQDWQDLEILATWDNGSIQPNITTSQLKFVNESAEKIREWVSGGLSGSSVGIFEGIPFEMILSDATNPATSNYSAFKGYLDLTEDFEELSPVEVLASLKKDNGLNSLDDRARGLTYGYLHSIGFISPGDYDNIDYVEEKPLNVSEAAILFVTFFLMSRELAQLVKEIAKDTAHTIAHTAGGVTGAAAGAAWQIASIIINLIYALILISLIVDLLINILELIFPPKRRFKGMKMRTLCEKAANYLGYNFSSSIPQMDNCWLLPSKSAESNVVGINQLVSQQTGLNYLTNIVGIPSPKDPYYTFAEMLSLGVSMFHSKVVITENNNGKTINLEPLVNDSFWLQNSGFTLPDVLNELKLYNTDECYSRIFINFQQDINDEWTLLDPRGIYAEIATQPITTNDPLRVGINGLNEVGIPLSLGHRKDQLSFLEVQLAAVAGVADAVVNALGGNSNLQQNIISRIGLLKMTSKDVNVPKILPLEDTTAGLRMPSTHLQIMSAQTLWLDYHVDKSFVQNINNTPYRAQKRLFRELKIPFGMTNFLQVVNSSYFNAPLPSGGTTVGKLEGLKWRFGQDYALVDGWVRDPYTANLEEIRIDSGQNGFA